MYSSGNQRLGFEMHDESGFIEGVHKSFPAFKKGLYVGMRLCTVNGHPYTKQMFHTARRSNKIFELRFHVDEPKTGALEDGNADDAYTEATWDHQAQDNEDGNADAAYAQANFGHQAQKKEEANPFDEIYEEQPSYDGEAAHWEVPEKTPESAQWAAKETHADTNHPRAHFGSASASFNRSIVLPRVESPKPLPSRPGK